MNPSSFSMWSNGSTSGHSWPIVGLAPSFPVFIRQYYCRVAWLSENRDMKLLYLKWKVLKLWIFSECYHDMDIHALIGAHKTKKQAPFFFLYNYMEQLLQRGKSSMAQGLQLIQGQTMMWILKKRGASRKRFHSFRSRYLDRRTFFEQRILTYEWLGNLTDLIA